MKYIKLSQYAKDMGFTYRTVLNYWYRGRIKGYQDEITGTIFIESEQKQKDDGITKVALYARVSSTQNKSNLDSQIDRLKQYAIAKGYTIISETKETASGLNDKRPKLKKLLQDKEFDILIVEHKDRLTRFGFNYIETLLNTMDKKIEVINLVKTTSEKVLFQSNWEVQYGVIC